MRRPSCTAVTATIPVVRALLITFLVLPVNVSSSTPVKVNNLGHTDIPTLVNSPEWQPFYSRLLSTPTLADLLASSAESLPRHLQSEAPVDELNTPCNEVLDTISLSDLKEIVTSIINVLAPSGSVQNIYLKSLLVDNLQTGIQVIQVCGSCTESIPNLDSHQDYCGPNQYGNDQLHSGMLLIPTQSDSTTANSNDTIVPGTHIGYIYTRGTTLSLTTEPSLLWLGRQDSSPIVWIYFALASAQSVVLLAPHYMGYGKSADLYKAYIIRKGYETSIVPLWYQSQTLIQELSGGCAALGNAAMVAGYSEGGYASVVVANALYRNAGVDIIQVQTGAGPYKTASAAMLGIFQTILNDNFPTDGLIILGLLGTSYSSTYPHLANFNTSQDVLSSINGTRELVVDAFTGIANPQVITPLLGSLSQSSILNLLRPAFVSAMEQFLTDGLLDPCSNGTTPLVDLEMDHLCAALVENDLSVLLEEQIQYPVEFCQSPNDEIVVEANLPSNLDSQFFSRVDGVTGDHFTAGETCFIHVLSTAMIAAVTLADYPVPPLHTQECNASASLGDGVGSAPLTMAPNGDASSSAAPSLWISLESATLLFFVAVFGTLLEIVVL